jgi:ABC-type microcin C transport system duplicated ATPase subunit YejF
MRATVRLLGQSAHLLTASPTEAVNPMRACSETYLLTNMPTDFEKSGGIFKNLVRNLKNTNGINATAQENIILIVVGNSVSKIAI